VLKLSRHANYPSCNRRNCHHPQFLPLYRLGLPEIILFSARGNHFSISAAILIAAYVSHCFCFLVLFDEAETRFASSPEVQCVVPRGSVTKGIPSSYFMAAPRTTMTTTPLLFFVFRT
jgi:hypothetical protein